MYPIPSTETLVETKTCRHCSASFPITDKDLEFYEKVSPTFGGKEYTIPTPTLCPDCRQQRRLSFRNERKLYKRKCDATGRDIVSIYSPDKPFKVYHQDFWWSDKWDPMDYGRDFDFERGFFEQFGEMMREIPKMSVIVMNNENADYVNYAGFNKDSYLIFNSEFNEESFYLNTGFHTKSCIDCLDIYTSENCYECIDITNCNYTNWCRGCNDCSYCSGCNDCTGCHYCILCTGLQNKQYCYRNIEYSQEEFYKIKRNLGANIIQGHKSNVDIPLRFINATNVENISGDNITHSMNVFCSYGVNDSKNCKYCFFITNGDTSYDITGFGIKSLVHSYESHAIGVDSNAILFSSNIVNGNLGIYYSYFLFNNCSNCFACIGLRNASYCILNRQYTKEQYEELVPRIIEHMMKTGEWGEFFPASLSPFGYNETVAQEYFPLTKSEATKDGRFNWSDYEPPFPKVEKIIPASKLPDDITKIPDDILNWAIECEVTKKPFRIIKQELEFYRKHNLPIPRRHPDQRHSDRMALRNPRKLFERKCDKCGKDMITTYSPERSERVYCEECYNREVVG